MDALVVGAGLLGLSASFFLSRAGLRVGVLDPRPPVSCTSDKSTECYRVFWPEAPEMALLVRRSLELLDGLPVRRDRRGYLYLGREETLLALAQGAEETGPLRLHARAGTYREKAWGMDLLGREALKEAFPCLEAEAGLHVRPAGWLDAWGLGQVLLEGARAQGARLVRGRLVGVETQGGRLQGAWVEGEEGLRFLRTGLLVNAAGPGFAQVARLLGEEPPVRAEAHFKAWFPDPQGLFPRNLPLVVQAEPVRLAFSEEEARLLAEDPEAARYLGPLPPGAHARPEGEGFLALYTPFPPEAQTPSCEPTPPPFYGEIALRALLPFLPGLKGLLGARARVDGGYYVHTPENRPLIGPLRREGAYALGGFSGFGVMTALGAGELLAAWVLGRPLPPYAQAFHPGRYQDPGYAPRPVPKL
jgi:glycine/D-amino acid oxidase-like deaminating enzyme